MNRRSFLLGAAAVPVAAVSDLHIPGLDAYAPSVTSDSAEPYVDGIFEWDVVAFPEGVGPAVRLEHGRDFMVDSGVIRLIGPRPGGRVQVMRRLRATYHVDWQPERRKALDELTALSQEMGLYG